MITNLTWQSSRKTPYIEYMFSERNKLNFGAVIFFKGLAGYIVYYLKSDHSFALNKENFEKFYYCGGDEMSLSSAQQVWHSCIEKCRNDAKRVDIRRVLDGKYLESSDPFNLFLSHGTMDLSIN